MSAHANLPRRPGFAFVPRRLGPWLPRPPTFNSGDKTLISRWRQYLKWEESNPLEIEESNRSTFLQRVQGVYKKATVRMRYYSEIWCVASSRALFFADGSGMVCAGIWHMRGI